ncbi:MAG: Rv1355c family protein [Bacteroidia bacterium]|nr:Rv1355c family protein [Bacteroidia bacterium]
MESIKSKLAELRQIQLKNEMTVKPVFYRLTNENQRKEFENLLKIPGIKVHDYMFDQIKELMKMRTAYIKFTDEQLAEQARNHISPLSNEEYGVWVYYPWSDRVVHIPDEDEFVEIRTSRNQYKITPEEKAKLKNKKIGVIGLSVGQSVAITIAMERICSEIRLADFDILELTNLNRIRTGIKNLGIYKVNSVAREIAEIDPFLVVKCFNDGLTEENMDAYFTDGGNLDLLIEESDGLDIKILCRHTARKLGIPVLMEASDKCMVDVERFDLEPNRSILHGLVDHLDINTLKTLKTNEEKIPYMLDILGIETSSLRLKASMLEIEQTITTWPQLASSVTMGGGITADVARRILLGYYNESGRYHVDIEELIGDKKPKKEPQPWVDPFTYTDVVGISQKYNVQIDANQALISDSQVKQILEAAIRAPSGGNYQPWQWAMKNNTLLLYYALDGNPVFLGWGNVSASVALGACLENAVLEAKKMKLDAKIDVFPDKNIKELVAQVKFFPESSSNSRMVEMADGINLRCTNRKLTKRPVIEPQILDELVNLAKETKGADLRFFTSENELNNIGEILGELEKLRLLEKGGQLDFSDEIRWSDAENNARRDGVDINTLDVSNSERAGLRIAKEGDVIELVNEWGGGNAFKKLTKKSIDSAGAVGILSMDGHALEDYFNGGRVLQRVWITSNLRGLAFQPTSSSVFVYARLIQGKGDNISAEGQKKLWALRPKFEEIFKIKPGSGDILIFRLTKAEVPTIKTLRRPLEMVFRKIV